jgi:hypothetical protein
LRTLEVVVAGGWGTTGEPIVSEPSMGVVFCGVACSVVPALLVDVLPIVEGVGLAAAAACWLLPIGVPFVVTAGGGVVTVPVWSRP